MGTWVHGLTSPAVPANTETEMAKGKQMSSKSCSYAKGGNTRMYGKMSTGTQKSGQTSQMGRGGGKFAKGGSTKMWGKQAANTQKSGRSSQH